MGDGDLTVHQAIAEIINEMGGIGKTSHNKEQNYDYRGIDAVLAELHPLFAKYGVFFSPDVIERIYEERTSKQGNIGHCAHLHVRYTIYGPTGDSIILSTWGEGIDYSDKATNKAMTAAFKYALFQLFAVCDPAEDADARGDEGGNISRHETPLQQLITILLNCGFTKREQKEIIDAATGRFVIQLEDLSADEIAIAQRAIESAIVDRDQLAEEEV